MSPLLSCPPPPTASALRQHRSRRRLVPSHEPTAAASTWATEARPRRHRSSTDARRHPELDLEDFGLTVAEQEATRLGGCSSTAHEAGGNARRPLLSSAAASRSLLLLLSSALVEVGSG